MLAILLSGFWVQLMSYQYFNPTLCFRYFTELSLGSFGNLLLNKVDSMFRLFF